VCPPPALEFLQLCPQFRHIVPAGFRKCRQVLGIYLQQLGKIARPQVPQVVVRVNLGPQQVHSHRQRRDPPGADFQRLRAFELESAPRRCLQDVAEVADVALNRPPEVLIKAVPDLQPVIQRLPERH
jgi:hypothetical protein